MAGGSSSSHLDGLRQAHAAAIKQFEASRETRKELVARVDGSVKDLMEGCSRDLASLRTALRKDDLAQVHVPSRDRLADIPTPSRNNAGRTAAKSTTELRDKPIQSKARRLSGGVSILSCWQPCAPYTLLQASDDRLGLVLLRLCILAWRARSLRKASSSPPRRPVKSRTPSPTLLPPPPLMPVPGGLVQSGHTRLTYADSPHQRGSPVESPKTVQVRKAPSEGQLGKLHRPALDSPKTVFIRQFGPPRNIQAVAATVGQAGPPRNVQDLTATFGGSSSASQRRLSTQACATDASSNAEARSSRASGDAGGSLASFGAYSPIRRMNSGSQAGEEQESVTDSILLN